MERWQRRGLELELGPLGLKTSHLDYGLPPFTAIPGYRAAPK